MMRDVIGWDIGGVNTKVARAMNGIIVAVRVRPFELQRDPHGLVPLLRALAAELGAGAATRHGVTMTAELSQMFRTKREGVQFVLDAVTKAFPSAWIRVYGVDGRFLEAVDARQDPLAVAAANWHATAQMVARLHTDAVLIDVGTTTTDIIPISGGQVAAAGRTDPERLVSGELVYTGALRTPAEAILAEVPLDGGIAGTSAEGFALAGDVHLWRGGLSPAQYSVAAPDGRPATREYAGERLARVVCADREMLDEREISLIADALAEAQVNRIAGALRRVVARHPSLTRAVVTGLGAFLAQAAAKRAGLEVVSLAEQLGGEAAWAAPAAAVALLMEESSAVEEPTRSFHRVAPVPKPEGSTVVDVVIKIGGSLVNFPESLDAVLETIGHGGPARRLLVVPGGGPFADIVRDVDRRLGLPDEAAHWMAVLAMDQYAHLLAARLERGDVVLEPADVAVRLARGHVPVLAPYRWLRDADPLPHSWDVTSDSLAAWVAAALGARRLVVVKAPEARGEQLTDAYFTRALPDSVEAVILTADRIDKLRDVVSGHAIPT